MTRAVHRIVTHHSILTGRCVFRNFGTSTNDEAVQIALHDRTRLAGLA
jgi:hypothetical protein